MTASKWLEDRTINSDASSTSELGNQLQPVKEHQSVTHVHVHRRKKNRGNNFGEEGRSLPMEMRPVIDSILQYGKMTNALGELTAVNMLLDIKNALVNLGLNNDRAIKRLIENIEKQIASTKLKFEVVYNGPDQK